MNLFSIVSAVRLLGVALTLGALFMPPSSAFAQDQTRIVKFGVVDVEELERESLMNKDIAAQISAALARQAAREPSRRSASAA